MADLDYTNICGSSFQNYVDTQIEKRKDLVYNEQRTPEQLQWLNNKNVWIRVSSGTNVIYGNKDYDGLEGEALSKKYILQGGVLNHPTDKEYNLRYGVGPDNAYGLKGGDFGNVPMPGITNISIKTGGKLGTLKETTIDFVCYGMEQLHIMEALYMKLGFSLLVEWGHTFFIDNKTGKVETNVQPLPFYGIHSKEELMEKITECRILHSGNYDATWGTIKNFSYTLDGNGAFKCQVQLVGAGDVLESLKINVSGNFKETIPGYIDPTTATDTTTSTSQSIYPVIADKNESLLNAALYSIYSKDVENADTQITNYLVDYSSDYKNILEAAFTPLNFSVNNFSSNTELQRKGYNFRLINTPGMDAAHTNNIDSSVPTLDSSDGTAGSLFSRLVVGYEIDGEAISGENDNTKPGLEQVYITLGNLLLLINSLGNLFDRKNEKTTEKDQKPFIYIDINPDTNRCYTFPGHCSLDPSICLIGSETLPFGITSELFDTIKLQFPFWGDNTNFIGMGDADLGGKFMYTLINVDWVASLIKKWKSNDTKGNVYFIDLVKDILDGISKATGGYNEFRIVPDDDTRCIRILDDRRFHNSNKTPNYTEIPILGAKSIVYNFSYTSKISPNTAAMVVVAAQAIPTGVQGAENALAFSHLNKGLWNRLGAVRVDSATDSNATSSPEDDNISRYAELRDFIVQIYGGIGGASAITQEQQDAELAKANTAATTVPAAQSGVQIADAKFKEIIRNFFNNASAQYTALFATYPSATKEITAMKASITEVNKYLTNSTVDTLLDKGSGFERMGDGTISYSEKFISRFVHELISKNYKSPNYYFDSDIEDKWDDIGTAGTGMTGTHF